MSPSLSVALGLMTALIGICVFALLSIDSKLDKLIDTNDHFNRHTVCLMTDRDQGSP